jgi:hypothetical protein
MLKWHHVGLISLRSWFESRSRYQNNFFYAYIEFDFTCFDGIWYELVADTHVWHHYRCAI